MGSVARAMSFLALFRAASSSSRICGRMPFFVLHREEGKGKGKRRGRGRDGAQGNGKGAGARGWLRWREGGSCSVVHWEG